MLETSALNGAYYANAARGSRRRGTTTPAYTKKAPAAAPKKRSVDEPAKAGADNKRSLANAPVDNKTSFFPSVVSSTCAAHNSIQRASLSITSAMTTAILLGTKYTAEVPALTLPVQPPAAATNADTRPRLSSAFSLEPMNDVRKMPTTRADATPKLPAPVALPEPVCSVKLDRLQAAYVALMRLPEALRQYYDAFLEYVQENGLVDDASEQLGDLDYCAYALRNIVDAQQKCQGVSLKLKFVADYAAVTGDDWCLSTWLPRAFEVLVDFVATASEEEAMQFCARLAAGNGLFPQHVVTDDAVMIGLSAFDRKLEKIMTIADATIPALMDKVGYYDVSVPAPCLSLIAKFCDHNTRRRLARTCKAFADAVGRTWNKMRLPPGDHMPAQRLVTHRLPHIKTLDLSLTRDIYSPYALSLFSDALPTRINKLVIDSLPMLPINMPLLQPRKLVMRTRAAGVDTNFSRLIDARRLEYVTMARKVSLKRGDHGALCVNDPLDKLDSHIHLGLGYLFAAFKGQRVECDSKENACILLDIIASRGIMHKALIENSFLLHGKNVVLCDGEDAKDFIGRAQADFINRELAAGAKFDSTAWQELWFPHLTSIEIMDM